MSDIPFQIGISDIQIFIYVDRGGYNEKRRRLRIGSELGRAARIVSQDIVLKISSVLCNLISSKEPDSLKASGWILKPQLEANRMALLNRQNVDRQSFSAEWLFTTGIQLFNRLSEVIPYVDDAIGNVLPRK